MKVTLPILAIFAGLAFAKLPGDVSLDNNGVDTNTIDDNSVTGPNFCPVGKACSSDSQCGSCSCNNWKGKCEE